MALRQVQRGRAWRRWSGVTAALLVAAVAVASRLIFIGADPPLLLTTDSITYAQPAMQLALGKGFDVSLRRTPGYPLFLAGLWSLFGPDPRAVLLAQHGLGIAVAVLTFLLGRQSYGLWAGLVAGLSVALSGPLLLYEHYLMTETLFTFLLVSGLLFALCGFRSGSARFQILSGVAFGLCALTRPLGQMFPLLLPLAALLGAAGGSTWRSRFRQATRVGLLVVVGYTVVTLPWVLRNRVVGGELTGSSAVGKTLFGRITRHDDGFRFDLPAAGPTETDPSRAQARLLARQAAQEDTSRGSLVQERLTREFGYSEAQALNVMRDAALDVILAQPGYYVSSSLQGTVELFAGQEEPLRTHLERLSSPRLRRDWLSRPELAALLPPPVPPETRWQTLGQANWMVRIYPPSGPYFPAGLGLLFTLGLVATVLRPAWRSALPLPILAIAVLLLSAFLDGAVPRFRYPVDPILGLVAAAGLTVLGGLALKCGRRVLRRAPDTRSGDSTTEPVSLGPMHRRELT